jgi:hypothetical protein
MIHSLTPKHIHMHIILCSSPLPTCLPTACLFWIPVLL